MDKDLFSNSGTNSSLPRETVAPHASSSSPHTTPLADRMRPRGLDEVVGQEDLLGPQGGLRLLLAGDSLPSLLFWGPPGCGKTTIARLLAGESHARFLEFSAVAVGSKELKAVMAEAGKFKKATGTRTILFLDEIHRFNKAQQDALLPWVERGDVTLIGATTENPSFEINSALISRTRLFVLQPLESADVRRVLERALVDPRGLNGSLALGPEALDELAIISQGDARSALGLLESIAGATAADQNTFPATTPLSAEQMAFIIQNRAARYDKGGEEHFNIISALHKSLRNSDVQAGLYWLTRMLVGGEDPLYISRRLVRFASEDVGLADPQALTQTLAARDAVHFIGMPEGALALAQAVVYLALAPKSNALYKAYGKTRKEVEKGSNPPVPLQLRNAPTDLMKGLGFGQDYVYAHDTTEGLGRMTCLPDNLQTETFYKPGNRGFEKDLADRMEQIRRWHEKRKRNSYPESQRAENPGKKDPGGTE
ncbi:MAG: replication-associated recombination protein A [Gemmatimonadales bacterium]|nr:replication-associated recombination protein A [Gemmatimonadales bacterium]